MNDAAEVVQWLIEGYTIAVNENDSKAYSELFATDAISVSPGSSSECGSEEIARGEQADYDQVKWFIVMMPIDILQIDDQWIYALVHVDTPLKFFADGSKAKKDATKSFLLQKQDSGTWLIKRYLWNLK